MPDNRDVPRVAIIACAAFPELGASDALYAAALRGLGAEVRVVAWNGPGDSAAALSGADTAVLRCPWDCPQDVTGFLRWLARRARGRASPEPACTRPMEQ